MQILELQYFPTIYLIKTLLNQTNTVFPLYERFRKMSFQNRMIIPAANGLTTLSVPLRGGRDNKDLLKGVRIDNSQRWQVRHWRTISAAYKRSPWFEFYEPSLQPLYEREYELLYEWNLDVLKWVLAQLKGETVLAIALEPGELPVVQGLTVPDMKPLNFNKEPFCRDLPVYAQVFQDRLGFQCNMSIADLIFNEGNKGRHLLQYAMR